MGSLECLYSLDSIRAALGFAGSRPLLLEVSTAMSYLNKSVLSPRQEAGLEMELDATNWQYSPFIFLYLLAVPIFWIVMLRFYYKQKKEGKTIVVTHPTIIFWRAVLGLLFVGGIIYGILHTLGVIP